MQTGPDLGAFVEERHGPVVAMLALYVGDRQVAQELAQDALVKLCRHWDEVATMDNPGGWLTTVAFNGARSWWRRRYAEQRARRRHGESDTVAALPDTETAMVVRSAVAKLPARQRQVIILRYFDDRSVADTARIMGCAEGTVKSLGNRARESLRRHGLGVATDSTRDPAPGIDPSVASPETPPAGEHDLVGTDTTDVARPSTKPGGPR